MSDNSESSDDSESSNSSESSESSDSTEKIESSDSSDTEVGKPPVDSFLGVQIVIKDIASESSLKPSLFDNTYQYAPPGIDHKRLVDWQIERHLQYSGKYNIWSSTDEMCAALDIRRPSDLQLGKPYGKGNIELNRKHCEYDPDKSKWGPPAAALLAAFNYFNRHLYKDPSRWILLEEPRACLVAMENWYFTLTKDQQKKLPSNAWDWIDLPAVHNAKWNRTFISNISKNTP